MRDILEYVRHFDGCPAEFGSETSCRCGLKESLAGTVGVQAIKLIDAQLSDGEGVGVLHYFESAYPDDPVTKQPDLAQTVRDLLSEDTP